MTDTLKTIVVRWTSARLTAQELDHEAWKDSHVVRLNRYWSGASAPAGRHAEARLLWSDEALNVRFVCTQSETLVVSHTPQTRAKTVGLWDRDVCEIFVAPDPNTPERYFEFEAAPTGEWVDLALHAPTDGRETEWEFSSGMTAAACIEPGTVIIAMRIPWSDRLQRPTRDERWRANLFRCVGSGETRGYLAWQPTFTPVPAFHVPEAFGWLRFG